MLSAHCSPVIDAITQDGRLFDASWLPRRLQQLLSQYKCVAPSLWLPCIHSWHHPAVASMHDRAQEAALHASITIVLVSVVLLMQAFVAVCVCCLYSKLCCWCSFAVPSIALWVSIAAAAVRYGLNNGQLGTQRDQLHAIADRMMYLCANCAGHPAVGAMLNTHCSLLVIK